MAIPDRPLELDIETRKFTLAEMAVFDIDEAEANPMGWINKMRKFLIARSVSWTRDEINAIEVDELEQVGAQVVEAVQKAAVPLANSPRSKTGRGGRAAPTPRAGRSNSSTRKNSTSRQTKSVDE